MRKVIGVMVLTTFALAGSVTSTYAQEEDKGCATALLDCFQAAANIESFWYRWAAGFDCELNFVECARTKLIGT